VTRLRDLGVHLAYEAYWITALDGFLRHTRLRILDVVGDRRLDVASTCLTVRDRGRRAVSLALRARDWLHSLRVRTSQPITIVLGAVDVGWIGICRALSMRILSHEASSRSILVGPCPVSIVGTSHLLGFLLALDHSHRILLCLGLLSFDVLLHEGLLMLINLILHNRWYVGPVLFRQSCSQCDEVWVIRVDGQRI